MRALVAALLLGVLAQDVAAQVVDLPVRQGVTQRYYALAPDGPAKAIVLLFTGSQGVANIPDRPGPTWAREGNFLTRSRELFRAHGLFVVVVDAPSDHRGTDGLGAYRIAPGHAEDIATIIADVRRRAPGAPVWLIGTSCGTISTANAAARVPPPRGADGLVLTSTLTARAPGARPRPGVAETVHDVDLGAIGVPTLIVHHRQDGCARTPPGDVQGLARALRNARRVETVFIEGGDPPRSDPCEALAAHGFLGREKPAVDAIAAFILDAAGR
jgi:pimeloyl-ACP methyl ester carboxylesterase